MIMAWAMALATRHSSAGSSCCRWSSSSLRRVWIHSSRGTKSSQSQKVDSIAFTAVRKAPSTSPSRSKPARALPRLPRLRAGSVGNWAHPSQYSSHGARSRTVAGMLCTHSATV